jgi:hypothetical protein
MSWIECQLRDDVGVHAARGVDDEQDIGFEARSDLVRTKYLCVIGQRRGTDGEAVTGAEKHTQGADFRGTHGEFLKLADARGWFVSQVSCSR